MIEYYKKGSLVMKTKNTLLVVKDIDASKKFYHQILGLHTLFEHSGRVILSGHITLQSLETWKDMIGENQVIFQNCSTELCFETDDIDAFCILLNQHRVPLVHSLKEQAYGQRVIRFYDLDGHIIEVSESLRKIIKRFLNLGLSQEEVSRRLNLPIDYIQKINRTG